MLPKKSRMDRLLFIKTKKSGQRFDSLFFSIIHTSTHDSQPSCFRASVVVSTKISKLAVTRNTIKRQIYSQLINFPHKVNLIIYPKTSVSQLSYEKIITQLNSDLSKIFVS